MLVPADVAEQPYYYNLLPDRAGCIEKLASELSKCACGKTDGDAASPNQKIFKNPLRGQSDRAAEFQHPHRATGATGAELLIECKPVTL